MIKQIYVAIDGPDWESRNKFGPDGEVVRHQLKGGSIIEIQLSAYRDQTIILAPRNFNESQSKSWEADFVASKSLLGLENNVASAGRPIRCSIETAVESHLLSGSDQGRASCFSSLPD